jgi:hypothetical protein
VKVIVYTAIIGDYDKLNDPEFVDNDFNYVCFTNGNIKSKVFDVRKVSLFNSDKIRTARRIKILPHTLDNFKNYDYSIWMDGNILIKGDLRKLIKQYLKDVNIAVMKHRGYDCLYKEAQMCIKLHKDVKRINKQIQRYTEKNYPENNGLLESGFIIRRHNKSDVIAAMEYWWHHVKKFSYRDQISFNYCAKLANLNFKYMMKFQSPQAKKYFVLTCNHKAGRNRKW